MEAQKGYRVKDRDGSTPGAKLLTVSISGLQKNCYRPVQKLISFETVKNNKVNSNNERPGKRAVVEVVQLYYW